MIELIQNGESAGSIREKINNALNLAQKVSKCIVGCTSGGWTEGDCDYLCTGTNDVSVIDQAISAVGISGEIIFLSGTYNINEYIIIPNLTTTGSGITFSGNGNNTIFKLDYQNTSSSTTYMFSIAVSSSQTIQNIIFQNICFDGNNKTNSKFFIPHQNSHMNYTYLRNCTFRNFTEVISIGSYVENLFIVDNIFENCDTGISFNLRYTPAQNIIISNNIFNNIYGCIQIEYTQTTGHTDNIIINGNVINAGNKTVPVGTEVYGAIDLENVYCANIDSNIIQFDDETTACYAIRVSGDSRFVTVSNNISTNSEIGISADANDLSIVGNICYNSKTSGISVSGDRNIVASNITYRGTGTSGDYTSSQNTISLLSTSEDCLVSNNLIMGKNITNSGTTNSLYDNKYS